MSCRYGKRSLQQLPTQPFPKAPWPHTPWKSRDHDAENEQKPRRLNSQLHGLGFEGLTVGFRFSVQAGVLKPSIPNPVAEAFVVDEKESLRQNGASQRGLNQ